MVILHCCLADLDLGLTWMRSASDHVSSCTYQGVLNCWLSIYNTVFNMKVMTTSS